MKHYEYIIIGFGKGGKTLAADLAARGKTVAMIEKSNEMYGGTCINIACIPTKLLIHHAKKDSQLKNEKSEYYRSAIEDKNKTIAALREKNYKTLADQDTVMVYTAEASFVGTNQVRLKSTEETLDLTADYFIINTGSEPVIPPIDGLKEADHVYTSTELQQVAELPEKLIIVGGGYIGLEFAVMYANFGSEIIVIDSASDFMENDDRDIAEEVLKVMQDKGISVVHGSKATAVSNHESGGIEVTLEFDKGKELTETASALLLATGRKPYTEGLELAKAGVEVDDNGAIIVDDYLRTSNRQIWALGDVNGGPQFTYISLDDYRIVRDQILTGGSYSLAKRKNVPYSVFIEPVLSHVGLNEKMAQEQNINYVVATMPAANIPRTKINNQPNGLLKALVDPETKRILGCTLFSAESSEMINTVRVAMEADLPYTFLRDNIFTHPTMSEGLNDLFKKFDGKLA
ncbi:FAD-dependent oxidoreductase [Oceanobacillus indicireducens]|uniref:Pyridine nucleotide-disulfide oxidoreductase n=1 Tax=Oceanobacillus indicireducens TaxID=1004261 RepID=A0A917XVN4_9BACI|nr:FAD-dependent oxidoreductase [Oceanobacillus indicireducens]GGN55780.1 pyridine nucleotide-disulfide oxidoreductase [Oceanobacillus indicireducens]